MLLSAIKITFYGFIFLHLLGVTACGKIGDPIPPRDSVVPSAKTAPYGLTEKLDDCADYCSDEANMPGKNFEEKD
jgi:hypothetical protein